MSEYEPNSYNSGRTTGDFQLDMLVAELETRFGYAENAMSELRNAIARVKAYRPAAQAAPAPFVSPPAAAPTWQEQAVSQPERAAAPEDDETKREDVSRMVAEAREQLSPSASPEQGSVGIPFWPGPKQEEPVQEKRYVEEYGVDSTSEGSWPIARQPQGKPIDFAPVSEVSQAEEATPVETNGDWSTDAEDDARREEVARIVANMRDDDEEEDTEGAEDAETGDDEPKRRDVAKMVADLRGGIEIEPDASDELTQDEAVVADNGDDEARREEVARMVAEMRNGANSTAEGEDSAETGDDESKREDVAAMVAEMRGQLDESDEAPDAGDDDADAAVRDEVRRAVEAARAEMSSGYKNSEESDDDITKRFSFPDWQSTHVEPSGPPVIVIKDSEGKVELARVYETLSRVNCDENAALLNYTPHSVTVGLNARATVPEVGDLTEAVRSVFGREAKVDSDGVRVNVQIGKDLKNKDSAA